MSLRQAYGTPLHCSCLENPWTEEPGGPQPMGSQSQTRRNGFTYVTFSPRTSNANVFQEWVNSGWLSWSWYTPIFLEVSTLVLAVCFEGHVACSMLIRKMQKFLSGDLGSRNRKGSRNNRLFRDNRQHLRQHLWSCVEAWPGSAGRSGKVCGYIKGFGWAFQGVPGSTPEPSWVGRQETELSSNFLQDKNGGSVYSHSKILGYFPLSPVPHPLGVSMSSVHLMVCPV